MSSTEADRRAFDRATDISYISPVTVEFHYYILHFLALRAGFGQEEARIVAYSSQLVDSSIFAYTVHWDGQLVKIEITQNYGWWEQDTPRDVYIPFHFFPGDEGHAPAKRTDGRRSRLSCTPSSPRVKEQLIRALKTRNLYRVGIALHTFADSWAHQNFSGLQEDWNVTGNRSLVPSIGHAQALTAPDDLAGVWVDPRIREGGGRIDNWRRFHEAGSKIYKYLCTYNRRSFDDVELVMDELERMLGVSGRGTIEKSREERILDLIIGADIQQYDRNEWLDEAVYLGNEAIDEELFTGYSKLLWLRDTALYRTSLLRKKPLEAKKGFADTHLLHWNDAAREHREAAWVVLGRILG